uniref:Uncharacterized protein n=1 Tax=Timema bartmani TaxID=61472 RepID=A0A7R9F5T8_9NEOP|nr:unnamed protein product [Timema bartmani]
MIKRKEAEAKKYVERVIGDIGKKESRKGGKRMERKSQVVRGCAMAGPEGESTEAHRKGKGRTGWPQHVWALELKQEQV